MSSLSRAIGRLCWRCPLAYEFARVLRSFLHHTRILLWQGLIALAYMGPGVGYNEYRSLVDCTRTRGRIADTQAVWASNPRMSGEDLQMFLAGWSAGARWSDSHKHSCTPQNGESLAPCMSPSSDFKPYLGRKPRRVISSVWYSARLCSQRAEDRQLRSQPCAFLPPLQALRRDN
jgi:hypothetical protein